MVRVDGRLPVQDVLGDVSIMPRPEPDLNKVIGPLHGVESSARLVECGAIGLFPCRLDAAGLVSSVPDTAVVFQCGSTRNHIGLVK